MDDNYKTIITITFYGKRTSWHMWSRRFLSKPTVQNQIGFINGIITVPTDAEVNVKLSSNKMTDEDRISRTKNAAMYSELIISCTDETSFLSSTMQNS